MATATDEITIEPEAYGMADVLLNGERVAWISTDRELRRQTVTLVGPDGAWAEIALAKVRQPKSAYLAAVAVHPERPAKNGEWFGTHHAEPGALTSSDFNELRKFARNYGKGWRAALRRIWESDYCNEWARRIRNTLGPSGLARVKV